VAVLSFIISKEILERNFASSRHWRNRSAVLFFSQWSIF
jgi:hypothetical protein